MESDICSGANDADNKKDNIAAYDKKQAGVGGAKSPLGVFGAKASGNDCVKTDAGAGGNGIEQIHKRGHQRDGS